MQTEQVNFNENDGCLAPGGIHREYCYVMFPENRAGLAKINRALKSYHHNKRENGDLADSAVGNPHEICIIREKLQNLRFEML